MSSSQLPSSNEIYKPGAGQRRARINWLFIFTVIIPTALSVVYYTLIAADRYISESRFVVRSPQRQVPSTMFGTLLQGTGFNRSLEDTYSIQDFILSRDALAELNRSLHVGAAFRKGGSDVINRFPALDLEDNFEALFRYYPRRVSVSTDSASSVSVLKVSAFAADDAYRINEKLLQMSEHLVNKLNERARKDTIGYASTEVEAAEKSARTAALALADYRNRKSVIDPERQSVLQFQQIAKLQEELFGSRTLLSQLSTYTPENPQIPALRTRVNALQKEIASESAKVTGSGSSLANKASEYERLALERSFADKQLATALAALETARSDAQRQMLYLERVVQPNLPDAAIEPRRIRSVLVVLILGLMTWGIVSLLVASVREHLA
jgi:capsular polysaccharide transport system permease protein